MRCEHGVLDARIYRFESIGIHRCQVIDAADWKEQLSEQLPLLGHRNWIVVADSAYPSQTAPGIKTIYAGGDQIEVLKTVLSAVDKAQHVRPVIMLDAELPYVPEKNAKGITQYRTDLKQSLGRRVVQSHRHEDIIKLLDEAGKSFHVLLIKTDLTLPYTSIFLQLDAGYWSAESEQHLREEMRKTATKVDF